MRNLARTRDYAALLARKTRQNPATASPLAQSLVESEYEQVSENKLITEAKNLLRSARLTAFTVSTKAEAIAILRGLQMRRP